MSELQARPEPLARKLSMLKLHLAIPAHAAIFVRLNFAASDTKILGSPGQSCFGAIAALREASRSTAWSSSVINIAVTNLCHFARPRKAPQLRSRTQAHLATKRPQGPRRVRFESS